MKITRKRYQATITNRETGETLTLPLYDLETGEGTSGEGQAFKVAQKFAKQTFPASRVTFGVDAVNITAELDIVKAVKAGAVGAWTVTD